MADLWSRLEHELSLHAPKLASGLRPGADGSAIEAYETATGQSLPPEVREAYLRHDGCRADPDFMVAQKALGLFGYFRWLPLSESLEAWHHNFGGFDESEAYWFADEGEAWEGCVIRPWIVPPPSWLPIAQRRNPTMHLYVDTLPGQGGTVGQLVGQDVHGPVVWLEATGLDEYLAGLAQGLENGSISVFVDPAIGDHQWVRSGREPYRAAGYMRW
jgi:cell wall assembly regulator SMI1